MVIDNKIGDEKLQSDIYREAAKISALSSGKIDKYEFLTGKEMFSLDQRGVIEQAKFAYSALEEAFEKQRKAIEEQGKNKLKLQKFQIQKKKKNQKLKSIEGLFPKEMRNDKIKNEIDEIRMGKQN